MNPRRPPARRCPHQRPHEPSRPYWRSGTGTGSRTATGAAMGKRWDAATFGVPPRLAHASPASQSCGRTAHRLPPTQPTLNPSGRHRSRPHDLCHPSPASPSTLLQGPAGRSLSSTTEPLRSNPPLRLPLQPGSEYLGELFPGTRPGTREKSPTAPKQWFEAKPWGGPVVLLSSSNEIVSSSSSIQKNNEEWSVLWGIDQ